MNRIYLLSTDGRIFFLDPSNSHIELLQTEQLTQTNIKFKKLSSSSWCFWCILANFEVNLFVYQLDTPIKHKVITYENQRRFNVFKKDSFVSTLLPTDRFLFSSQDGTQNLPKESFTLPTENWSWDSDWCYEQTMSDGWEYAIDFPANYHSTFFTTALVRRKKWLRTRTFNSYEKFIRIDSPTGNECIIDISTGGWDIEYCDKGFLCVWCVSNSGKVFFRENVSFMNLEGTNWKEINLPKNSVGASSVSCASNGQVWFILWDGSAMVRTGISRNEPFGTNWIEIKKPSESFGLRQICVGSKAVWALDNQGCVFYRFGINYEGISINSDHNHGSKWISVPGTMNSISISHSNQLWAINEDQQLCYRDDITDDCLSGRSWRQISLLFKKREKKNENELQQSTVVQIDSISENKNNDENEQTVVFNQDHEKIKETTDKTDSVSEFNTLNSEVSIYDSIYDDSSLDVYSQSYDINNNNKNDETIKYEKSKGVANEIRNSDFVPQTTETADQLKYNLANLNNFIENLKEQEKRKEEVDEWTKKNINKLKSYVADLVVNESLNTIDNVDSSRQTRSDSNASFSSSISVSDYSMSLNNLKSLNKETDSMTSMLNLNVDENLNDVILKFCDASSCNIRSDIIPANWLESISHKNSINGQNNENDENKGNEWRNQILQDLKNRNYAESKNSEKFQKAIDSELWSSKADFKILNKRSKLNDCSIEIISNNIDGYLFIKIMKKPGVVKNEMRIEFKDILCVTRYTLPEKQTSATFAIYEKHDVMKPLIFFAQSEKLLFEWVNQISLYCSKFCKFTSLSQAITSTNADGNVYFAFIEKTDVNTIRQITGHFNWIEKHLSGCVMGIGSNGKLWTLQQPNELLLDSYRGMSIQTDEVEVYTYENQRWNVLMGFSTIGFPTDRYMWSDETGKLRRRKEDLNLLSSLYTWITDWQVDFSTPGGVDKEGWQYAIDFPRTYHPVRNNLDFVRRRRWCRKCRIRQPSYWVEVFQSHNITSIAFDMEEAGSMLPENCILVWATEADGHLLCALINKSTPSVCKWQYVPSETTFKSITIGSNLRVYGVTSSGNCHFRYGVNCNSNYCGNSWSVLESPDLEIKMKHLSAGNCTLWAISEDDSLYYRENICESFPEGTNWVKVSDFVSFVSVNKTNQVYCIESSTAKDENGNVLLGRVGVAESNPKGVSWKPLISMKSKMISNRGVNF